MLAALAALLAAFLTTSSPVQIFNELDPDTLGQQVSPENPHHQPEGKAKTAPDHDGKEEAIPLPFLQPETDPNNDIKDKGENDDRDNQGCTGHIVDRPANTNLTEKAHLATIASAVIALITAVLLGLTLLATGRMLKEAKAATRAAEAAVEVTREIGRDQMRGYLDIDKAAVDYQGRSIIRFQNGRHDALGFMLWIKNTGMTPIRWYKIAYLVEVRDTVENGRNIINVHHGQSPKWPNLHSGISRSFSIQDRTVFEMIQQTADAVDDWIIVLKLTATYGTIFYEEREEKFEVHTYGFRLREYRDRRRAEVATPLEMQISNIRDENNEQA